jgi:glycosyltransferase involved in cell wall biosynthesis
MTELRVLIIQAGNPIASDDPDPSRVRLTSIDGGGEQWFRKGDMVNATDQRESLSEVGVRAAYGVLSARKSIAALVRAGFRLRRLAREHGVQLVHVHWGITTSLVTVLFAGRPVVISFAGSDLFGLVDGQGRRTLQGRVSRLLSQLSSLGAQRVIVKSARMLDVLWPSVRRRAVVIPNGVDVSRFVPVPRGEARARLGWAADAPVILFFAGTGSSVKNRPLAEAAVERLRVQVPTARLMVVQGVPHEDLFLYYSAADAMLLTSFHEGSNNSLKEAMCCNLPIVSVDCGDARERLAGVRNSVVVDRYDADLLARALVDILRCGQRSDGRSHAASIALPEIARRVRRVYDEALGTA